MSLKKRKIEEAEELTPEQLTELKNKLLAIRKELNDKARLRESEGAYQISRDDLSDEGDLAGVEIAQEVGLALAEADRVKLKMVDDALKKIEKNDDSYGYCEGTGDAIGFRRLSVAPWAKYSLRYQEELERNRRA